MAVCVCACACTSVVSIFLAFYRLLSVFVVVVVLFSSCRFESVVRILLFPFSSNDWRVRLNGLSVKWQYGLFGVIRVVLLYLCERDDE